MKVYFELIRHGETPANELHQYLGQTDEGLSEEGKRKLFQWKDKNMYILPDFVFTSPMTRCLESAQILFPSKIPQQVEDFKEINFGIFEKKTYEELKDVRAYQEWLDSNCEMQIPQGESKEEYKKRVIAAFDSVVMQLSEQLEKEKRYLTDIPVISFVVHGGTIMSLMSNWVKDLGYYDFQVKNGQGYLCTMELEKNSVKLIYYKKITTEEEK